ncbi:MAG: helix-turn-helix transcriptional regulator [Actinopolymorphaceae bacterium]
MDAADLLERAHQLARLTRAELARRAGTSRPTLAAYASGAKTPTLATALRIIRAAGFDLELIPQVEFVEVPGRAGRLLPVPTRLPRLLLEDAFAHVQLPLHLNWSTPERTYDMADRQERARVYEIVLREGTANDILTYIDGALLLDLWPDLILPTHVRQAWAPTIERTNPTAA